ncbi:hypothetical protein DER44DRAFT_814067 [Fusarium oxysporum]|nr:hypothetical protein DER44DRAFT_814067 [Fusarium oxysporum]
MAASTSDSVPERSHLLFEQNPTEDEPSPDNTAKGTSTSNTDKQTKPPFWLSKYALLMFCVIFITLAASLIVLKYVSDAQDGSPLNFSSGEYTWTYGPTAILVIVLTEPWRELQSGPVVASKSLLLDYVSPFQPFSAFHAFRIGHYRKAWTSPAFYSTLQFEDCVFFSGGSDQGIWHYLARLNNAVANDSTWKTVDGRVTQRFTPPQSVFNLTALEAPVDVFVPHVACEEATLSIDFDVRRSRVEYSWTSDTCSTGRHDAYLCPDHRASGYNITTCGETPRAYSLHRANCSTSLTHDGDAEYRRSDDLEDHDIRYAITVAQYTIDMDVAENNVSQAISLVNHSAVICKIGYNIVSGSATLDMNGGRQLKNLTNSSLAEMLITNLDTSSTALVVDKDIPIMTVEPGVTDMDCGAGDAFAQLIAVKLGEHFKPSILWQPFVLRNISIDILEGLLDEFARESLLVNKLTNGTAKGLASHLMDRKSWTPISGRRRFVVATLAFPLLAIGGLELLQQLSSKRQGLVDMHRTDSTSISYTIRIASTATVFAIATLVNSLDFTITAFAPYSSLRGGNSPPERSILFHLLSVSPFLIFFKSLRACHFGPAASNISSLLSSFLTIIVSGLWTLTGPVTLEGPFSAMVGNWRSTWPVGAVDDGGAAMILNLVRYGGANTSSSIWQDLVLPRVSLTSSTPISDDIYRSANYTYVIGGLRPLLDCSVVPQENLTMTMWRDGLEQVPVTVTYKGNPSLREINEQHPPKLELEKAWRWVNGTSKSKAFGYQPGRFLDADLTPFPIDEPDTRTFDEDDDPFFDHLLHGPNRIERESLLGPSNTEKLIRAVQRDYSEYMRHVIDLNFRANSSNAHDDLISAEALPNARPSSVATEITGTTSAQVTRLAIHTTSKLLLQILLGLMALLSLASYLLVKIDGTLPRNPCSIASTMAFLAGSQLCDRDAGIIPQGAEHMTDGQLKEVFDGWVFSLGWWQKEEASVESEEPNDDASTLGDRDVPDEAQEGRRTPGRFGIDVGRANVSKF